MYNIKYTYTYRPYSFYSGIIYCLASLGVAAGYMGGGQFLNIYTDADKVDVERYNVQCINT